MAELKSIHVTPGGGGIQIPKGETTYSGNLLGTGRLTKLGMGALRLTIASPDFTGTLAVTRGAVRLDVDQLLSSQVSVVLRDGTLACAGVTQSFLTPLMVQSRSSISLDRDSRLSFGDSSSTPWPTSARIVIEGEPGNESLRVGNSAAALTSSQLARIRFGSPRGPTARLTNEGYLVPI